MTLVAKRAHTHKFTKPVTRKVLLYEYRSENGIPKPAVVTGYDMLQQLKCECGKVSTINLERTRLQ